MKDVIILLVAVLLIILGSWYYYDNVMSKKSAYPTPPQSVQTTSTPTILDKLPKSTNTPSFVTPPAPTNAK